MRLAWAWRVPGTDNPFQDTYWKSYCQVTNLTTTWSNRIRQLKWRLKPLRLLAKYETDIQRSGVRMVKSGSASNDFSRRRWMTVLSMQSQQERGSVYRIVKPVPTRTVEAVELYMIWQVGLIRVRQRRCDDHPSKPQNFLRSNFEWSSGSVLPRCVDVSLGSAFGSLDDRWRASQHDSIQGWGQFGDTTLSQIPDRGSSESTQLGQTLNLAWIFVQTAGMAILRIESLFPGQSFSA